MSEAGPGGGVIWIQRNRLLEKLGRFMTSSSALRDPRYPFEIKLVGFRIRRRGSDKRLVAPAAQGSFHLCSDGPGDFVFDRKNVRQLAIVLFRPEMIAGPGIDKLSGNPDVVGDALETAFKDVGDRKRFADAAKIDVLAFELKRGCSCRHF